MVTSLNWSLFCYIHWKIRAKYIPLPLPHVNISFVCGSFCFVLHAASRGDKARVIWPTMKRTGKWFLADPAVLKGKSLIYQEVKHTVTDLMALSTYLPNLDYMWDQSAFNPLCPNVGYFIKCFDFYPKVSFQCLNDPFSYTFANILLLRIVSQSILNTQQITLKSYLNNVKEGNWITVKYLNHLY